MNAFKVIAALAVAYAFGSIPMGVMIGKLAYKTDIRRHGSGNTGMANAYRTFGPAGGIIVLLLDVTKGAAAVLLPKLIFFPGDFPAGSWQTNAVIVGCGLAAIIGASYSVFLGFSGGKSVGASVGVILSLFTATFPYLALVWITVVAITRYISAGAIGVAVIFPVAVMLVYPGHMELVAVSALIAVLVFYRHADNLFRILNGTERKFEFKPKKESG